MNIIFVGIKPTEFQTYEKELNSLSYKTMPATNDTASPENPRPLFDQRKLKKDSIRIREEKLLLAQEEDEVIMKPQRSPSSFLPTRDGDDASIDSLVLPDSDRIVTSNYLFESLLV